MSLNYFHRNSGCYTNSVVTSSVIPIFPNTLIPSVDIKLVFLMKTANHFLFLYFGFWLIFTQAIRLSVTKDKTDVLPGCSYNTIRFQRSLLIHWGRVRHICVGKLTTIGYYLNQWWNIVNWTLGNKFQWNVTRNLNIFMEENTFENVVCEMLSISSRLQCVKATDLIKNDQFI